MTEDIAMEKMSSSEVPMDVDPTDKKYQLSDRYPPDKESTWPFPKEDDGWVKAHDALRRDISTLVKVFEALANRKSMKQWESDAVQKVWSLHQHMIHDHHTNEDDIIGPWLATRFKYPASYADDHEVIVEKISRISALVNECKEGTDASELANELKEYQRMLLPHFIHEENVALPLLRAYSYFTHKEMSAKMQEILQKSLRDKSSNMKFEIGSFIDCMGEDEFRNKAMKYEGIPGILWHLFFKPGVKVYRQQFVKPTDALISGVEVQPEEALCSQCAIM